jgi:mono/diheme cytochrome c family protein
MENLMARKIVKWLGMGLGVIVALLLVAGAALSIRGSQMVAATYTIEAAGLAIPDDEASRAEGERLVDIRACKNCHGGDLAGGLLVEHPLFGTFYAANLTGGHNSATANYTPADWARAIRHGVGPNSKGLWAMPSFEYSRISDEDLALMIAYLESLPEVDQSEPYPEQSPKLMARILLATGQVPLISATLIDHTVRPPASIPAVVSVEYGEYLATTCTGCHKPDFSGGASIGSDPANPPPDNLTPAGDLANWTQGNFINTMRTGVTPEGKTLDPEFMPWPITARMTDDELAAIWTYLSTLPGVE